MVVTGASVPSHPWAFSQESRQRNSNQITRGYCAARKFSLAGVRARPNQKWSTAKTAGKTVSPGVFPRFGEGDFPFGGLGGEYPPSRAPRLGSSGAFFRFFCLRGYAPQSRPLNQARCKNQREALVPKYTAPEPGPLGGLPNLPLPLTGQKGTFRSLPAARTSRFPLFLTFI